jgi:hypothetical protein
MLESDPSELLEQTVTLVGTARDAHQGAVVVLADGTPVYIAGLPSWEDAWDRKRIVAKGVLRRRRLAPDPAVGPRGERSHGMVGASLMLEDATWEAAP